MFKGLIESIIAKLEKIIGDYRAKQRVEKIKEECGCVCFCPNCKDPLNDQGTCQDNNFVVYLCNECGYESIWSFDLAPVPIVLHYYKVGESYHKEEDQ